MNLSKFGEASEIKVSLVVPIRNEAGSLDRLLESVAAQTRQPDEIVFVDGGSRDGTEDLLRNAQAMNPKVRVISATTASPGLGRNIGIANARYEWIALTNAGIQLDPHWLERLIEVAESKIGIDIVCGNFEPVIDSFFKQCASVAYGPIRMRVNGGSVRGPFIASSLVRREAWRSVGGFLDLRAAEDLIFFEELKKRGCSMEWAPGAVVHWEMRPTLASTFHRFVLYSKCNVWAKRQPYWHYGIVRLYALTVPFLILGVIHRWWWFLVPLVIFSARVMKRIWQHRRPAQLVWVLNPLRIAAVATILIAIDLATFVGWIAAILNRGESRRIAGTLVIMRGD